MYPSKVARYCKKGTFDPQKSKNRPESKKMRFLARFWAKNGPKRPLKKNPPHVPLKKGNILRFCDFRSFLGVKKRVFSRFFVDSAKHKKTTYTKISPFTSLFPNQRWTYPPPKKAPSCHRGGVSGHGLGGVLGPVFERKYPFFRLKYHIFSKIRLALRVIFYLFFKWYFTF